MSDRLYNKDLKLEYVNDYFGEENTKTVIMYLFVKSANVERQYNKDIYAFTDKEISSLLLHLRRDNILSLHKDVSFLKDYVKWCIGNGKRGIYENGENRVAIFQATEDLNKYVSRRKVKNKFLTKEELNVLINHLENPMDQAFILALHEFIGGEELYELRALKMEDVIKAEKNDNRIEVTDKNGNKRYPQISTKLIEFLKEANNQKEYSLNNGDAQKIPTRKLTESCYIFKPLVRKSNVNQMMGYGSLINKINLIKKYTGYDFVTVNSLKDTRIIHEMADIANKIGLDKANEDVYRIAIKNISNKYDIKFSSTQIYDIRRKYEQVVKLKDFS